MLRYPLDPQSELRLLQPHHAEALQALAMRSRAHLSPWLPWAREERGVEFFSDFIRRRLEALASQSGYGFSVWQQQQIAGVIGLYNLKLGEGAEVGYWLGEEFTGQGLATKAVRAVTDFALGELELRHLNLEVYPHNHKSRAIPERLGFMNIGLVERFEDGTKVQHLRYQMRAEDWR